LLRPLNLLQVLAAVARLLGGGAGLAACRLTPSDVPGLLHPHVCLQLLQCLFSDLAVHNDAQGSFRFQAGRHNVVVPNRVPSDWRKARADLTYLRGRQAAHPACEFQLGIYTVGGWVGGWVCALPCLMQPSSALPV
jgi:hypothetical protein